MALKKVARPTSLFYQHHFVPDYLVTGVRVLDERRGLFWIAPSCGVADGDYAGLLTGLWRGEVTGLEPAVAAANPHAVVSLTNGQEWGVDAAYCYLISIDYDADPAAPSPISELVGMNGLLEVDLSRHIYEYKD